MQVPEHKKPSKTLPKEVHRLVKDKTPEEVVRQMMRAEPDLGGHRAVKHSV